MTLSICGYSGGPLYQQPSWSPDGLLFTCQRQEEWSSGEHQGPRARQGRARGSGASATATSLYGARGWAAPPTRSNEPHRRGRFKRQSGEGRKPRTQGRRREERCRRKAGTPKKNHGHAKVTGRPSHRAFRRSMAPPTCQTCGLRD